MQPWPYTSEFSRMNMDFLCNVIFNYLTMDYPLPHTQVHHWTFLFICLTMRFATEWRVSDNRGRPRLVCVHDYTATFPLKLSMVEGAYNPPPPTNTRTHTHAQETCTRFSLFLYLPLHSSVYTIFVLIIL